MSGRERENLQQIMTERGLPGLLLCTPNGRILYSNQAAASILPYLDARGSGTGKNRRLPTPLRSLICRLTARQGDSQCSSLLRAGRRWYVVQVDRLELIYAHQPGIAILFERVSPTRLNHLSRLAHRHRLTPRETQIIKGILQGLGDKEIASEIKLSPNSVRQYLKSIRLKLSCHTRTAILTKLLSP